MHGPDGFEKQVCIKRIRPEQSSNPGFEAMFRDEARLAALLRHANIVHVFDFDRDEDGRLFICMEFVEGVNLKRFSVALAEKSIRPGHDIAAALARGVLEGLHHACTALHEGRPLGVIHRDISPHNILLSTSGEIKITDFGIAKAFISSVRTRTGVIKGKASYMSPEQAAGARLDGRTDLFSLGVVLWETISGRRLFKPSRGEPWLALLPQARVAPPIASECPDVPPGLARLVDALLQPDRDHRPANAARALEMLLDSGVVPAFSTRIETLVREAVPACPPTPDPALQPTEPADAGDPTARDAPTRVETPGDSPPEPLDSGDIITNAASVVPRRSPGRRSVLVPLAALGGALLALALVIAWLASMPRPAPRPEPVPEASPAHEPPPPGEQAGQVSVGLVPATVSEPPLQDTAGPHTQGRTTGRGGIDINVKPWAEVYLNGRSVGDTPLSLKKIPAGRHRLRLVNPKMGVERKLSIVVKPGKTSRIALDFTE